MVRRQVSTGDLITMPGEQLYMFRKNYWKEQSINLFFHPNKYCSIPDVLGSSLPPKAPKIIMAKRPFSINFMSFS
jgi:hypothetical protein